MFSPENHLWSIRSDGPVTGCTESFFSLVTDKEEKTLFLQDELSDRMQRYRIHADHASVKIEKEE